MLEPGWSPNPNKSQQQAYRSVPAPVQQPVNRPANRPVRAPQQSIPHFDEGPPAWIGSLRQSGGARPWEVHAQDNLVPGQQQAPPSTQVRQRPAARQAPSPGTAPVAHHSPAGAVTPHQPRVQTVHHGPGGSQTIGQHDGGNYDGDAKVAHLQYNTPIGLYSKRNVEETLDAQTKGKAGYGTMQ